MDVDAFAASKSSTIDLDSPRTSANNLVLRPISKAALSLVTHGLFIQLEMSGSCRTTVSTAEMSAPAGLQICARSGRPRTNCSTSRVLVPRPLVCYSVLLGGDPVASDLQELISEYCAIEEMDRRLQQADPVDETELIGLRARAMRRREILRELIAWIIAAEDLVKRI